jgi:hypothetical protein
MEDYLVTVKVPALGYRGTFFAPCQLSVAAAKTDALLRSDVAWAATPEHVIEYDVRQVRATK